MFIGRKDELAQLEGLWEKRRGVPYVATGEGDRRS